MSGVELGRRCAFAIVCVVLLVGCVRLSFVVAATETGWETIRLQLQDATIGVLGLEHEPVDRQDPKAQAEFWMTAIDAGQSSIFSGNGIDSTIG